MNRCVTGNLKFERGILPYGSIKIGPMGRSEVSAQLSIIKMQCQAHTPRGQVSKEAKLQNKRFECIRDDGTYMAPACGVRPTLLCSPGLRQSRGGNPFLKGG